jgi:hypothetical protein
MDRKLCPFKFSISVPLQGKLFEDPRQCEPDRCAAWELLEGDQGFCKLIEGRGQALLLKDDDDF